MIQYLSIDFNWFDNHLSELPFEAVETGVLYKIFVLQIQGGKFILKIGINDRLFWNDRVDSI
jgi:hypothetical protein